MALTKNKNENQFLTELSSFFLSKEKITKGDCNKRVPSIVQNAVAQNWFIIQNRAPV
jgi:hypothetical protein